MPPLRIRTRITFLALFTSLVLCAQDDIAERLFFSGERAYAARSYAEALETWNQLLKQSPKSPFAAQALYLMARHRLEVEKKPDVALPLLDRLKTDYIQNPWAAEGLLLRGGILAARSRNAKDLKEAMAEFNRLLDLFPDHSAVQRARLQLGLAYRTLGQWGRAFRNFTDAIRWDPATTVAAQAQIQAAETLDITGDLQGCLRLLQGVCNQKPGSPEAADAAWRIAVRVKQRIQKAPLKSEGPWPQGKQKWLKTPTLLEVGPSGELVIFQDDLDKAFRLKGTELESASALAKGAKAMTIAPDGQPWLVTTKSGVLRGESEALIPFPNANAPSGAFLDSWGDLWVSDAKNGSITVLSPDGTTRAVPSPAAVAMAPLPTGGAVLASDTNRSLMFLDASGQPKLSVPYGKDLPGPFKYVVALNTDALGHVAALVDGGDFEGVVLWGPDGLLLRQATYKALGVSGKFRAIALDRQGGIILADRSNDVLIRLN